MLLSYILTQESGFRTSRQPSKTFGTAIIAHLSTKRVAIKPKCTFLKKLNQQVSIEEYFIKNVNSFRKKSKLGKVIKKMATMTVYLKLDLIII